MTFQGMFAQGAVAALALILLAGGVHAENMIWDESQGTPMPFTWNITNFDGFNIGFHVL